MSNGNEMNENILEQLQSGSALTSDKWLELAAEPESIFADTFPFFNDPKFIELKPLHQRYILAYTLKDLYGFRQEDMYRFAARNYTTTQGSAKSSAANLKKVASVRYFLDKLDWLRLEGLGYSTAKIIEAEAGLSYSDITDYLDDEGCFTGKSLKELPASARRAIKSFEILEHLDKQGNVVKKFKIGLWDKGASLQRMQKMKGLHKDVVETSNKTTTITGEMSAVEAAKAYQEMMKS